MNNVLANVASQVSPAAMAAGTPVALRVGHLNHAASLYSAFIVDAEKQGLSVLETLREMAITSGLTCVEFQASFKAAQAIADATDKSSGFTPAEGAKGIEKYGPKRRLLNQRGTEAKRLFGVFKLAPDELQEKGYWSALTAARAYLDAKGLEWDGNKAEGKEAKELRKAGKLERETLAAVMEANAQQDGESRADYLVRIDEMAEEAVASAQEDAFNKGVKTLFESLSKKHGPETMGGIFWRMLETLEPEELETVRAWIQEEMIAAENGLQS